MFLLYLFGGEFPFSLSYNTIQHIKTEQKENRKQKMKTERDYSATGRRWFSARLAIRDIYLTVEPIVFRSFTYYYRYIVSVYNRRKQTPPTQ